MPPLFQTSATPVSGRAVPDLSDETVRAELSDAAVEAMTNLARLWRLTSHQVSELLVEVSEAEWFKLRDEKQSRVLSQDALTRISALVGVYKGLHLLFSEPLADDWVRRSNSDPLFNGMTPLDHMLTNGLDAMIATRAYVDALRGGL